MIFYNPPLKYLYSEIDVLLYIVARIMPKHSMCFGIKSSNYVVVCITNQSIALSSYP